MRKDDIASLFNMDSPIDCPKYAETFKVQLCTYAEQLILEFKFAEKSHTRKEDLVKKYLITN
jgi:hypothetical protein